MSMDQFRKWMAKQGCEAADNGAYHMPLYVEKAEPSRDPAEKGMTWVTISTRKSDRMGDIIEQEGMDITAFKKNPVVLWAHQYTQLPIGRAPRLEKAKTATRALIQWDTSPFAKEVQRLYDEGFMRAFSVGILPKKWDVINDDEGRFAGYHITESELLEFSAVPVPANPQALREEMEAGRIKDVMLCKALGLGEMPATVEKLIPAPAPEPSPVQVAAQETEPVAPVITVGFKMFTETIDALKTSIAAIEKKIPAEAAPVAPSQPVAPALELKVTLPDAEKVADSVVRRIAALVGQEADKTIRLMRGQLD